MKIIIDEHYNEDHSAVVATQYLDLDAPISLRHPDTGDPIGMIEWIKWLNANPEHLESSGFNITSQIRDENEPTSRWERIVLHSMSDEAHPELRDANLTVPEKGGK